MNEQLRLKRLILENVSTTGVVYLYYDVDKSGELEIAKADGYGTSFKDMHTIVAGN